MATGTRNRLRSLAAPCCVVIIFLLAGAATAAAASPGSGDRSGLGCSPDLPTGVAAGAAWHAEIVQHVNDHRGSLGLAAVRPDPRLDRSATWKARDLIARGYAGHDDPGLDGRPDRTSRSRALTCGYSTSVPSENLLTWTDDPPNARWVVDGWLGSPGHRATIERPEWRFVGTGIARAGEPAASGEHRTAFVQQFGSTASVAVPRCSTALGVARIGATLPIDPLLCRTEGNPVLLGAAPSLGTLTGLSYGPPRAVGSVRFTMRWPDTGVVTPVEVFVQPALARVLARPATCTAVGRCVIRYRLVRPAVGSVRARLEVQRRVGTRWVAWRRRPLPVASIGVARTAISRGTWRMRVSIGRHPLQSGATSAWQVRRR